MSLWSWFTAEKPNSEALPQPPARRLRMGRLEDRVLMNATALPSGEAPDELHAAENGTDQLDLGSELLLPTPEILICESCTENELAELPPAESAVGSLAWLETTQSPDQPTELVVVDAQVTDLSAILSELAQQANHRRFDLLELAPNEAGLARIAEAVAGHQYAAIHILTHATDGSVQLGNQWLNAENVQEYTAELAEWGAGLTADGDILFYGCDLAEGTAGEDLLAAIADLTQADVAASSDLTGHQDFGADWDLEYHTGVIATTGILDPQSELEWHGLLAAVSFQEGTAGYTGTVDTFIESNQGNQDNSAATKLTVDLSPTNQGLIRFENLFGSGAGQIPWGSTINSASLTVSVEKTGAAGALIELHRVLVPWVDTSTWNSLTGGISTNNIEALTTADSVLPNANANGAQTFSGLAAALQAWANGSPNYGWVVTNNDANDWKMRSAEEGNAANRPQLTVNYSPPTLDPVGQQRVNTTTANDQSTLLTDRGASQSVAMADNGNYVIVWSSQGNDGSGWGVYGQRYDSHGAKLGGEFRVNTETNDDQWLANVSSAGNGDFVVTWTSKNQDGTSESIYAQRFASDGTPQGTEFRVNSTNTGSQIDSVVTVDRRTGDFVIAWEGEGPGDTDGIFFRKFAADGTAASAGDQIAHTADGTSQDDPAITFTTNGEFVIAWEQGNHGYFQRFDTAGSLLGGRTQIDNFLSNTSGIAIAADNAGDFTVVYRENNLLPALSGVWGKGFQADGSDKYSWFHVATNSAISPSIAMADDGSFVVTYEQSTDGDGLGVFARKYDASGSPLAAAFQVNQQIAGEQHFAGIAALDTDNFVVVWSGEGTGDTAGIFSHQYGPANVSPVISSNGGGATAAVNVAENSTTVTTVTATDADLPAQTLNYFIVGGADAALFAVDVNNGTLRFNTAPDFENRLDSDSNGEYEVIVEVVDSLEPVMHLRSSFARAAASLRPSARLPELSPVVRNLVPGGGNDSANRMFVPQPSDAAVIQSLVWLRCA